MALEHLVQALRRELADELPKMHSRAVPAEAVPIQVSRYDGERWQPNWDEWIEVLDAGEGPPFNPMFVAFLDGEKGTAFLAQSSIREVGGFCHARHSGHCEMDGCPPEGLRARTPLCERIVVALVELGQPIGQIAWRERLASEVIESIAVRALEHAKAWRHRELHRVMAGRRVNHRDNMLVVICPVCRGKDVRSAVA